jgi:thiamine pyrophosphokinase
VARLATESDLVIAVDGGGSVCLEAGLSPAVVLGDFDSLPAEDLERLSGLGALLVRFPVDKDASDLELAVAEARRRGATSVVFTCASSGRLDHTYAALGALAASADLRSRLVDPDLEVWALSPGGRGSLDLVGEGTTISLSAFGAPACVSAEGLVWEVRDVAFDPASSLGLSNRIGGSGHARISASSGVVLVFAPQVAGAFRAQGT